MSTETAENYRVRGVRHDSYPIDEIFTSKEDAVKFCEGETFKIEKTHCHQWWCDFCGFYISEKPKCSQCEIEE